MTKDELKTLKEDKLIRYIYKIPCKMYDESVFVIIGDYKTKFNKNLWYIHLTDWFERMQQGDILSHICTRLPKRYCIKEYLKIYPPLDIIKFRKYINQAHLPKKVKILQLFCANRLLKEGGFYRLEELNQTYEQSALLLEFYKLTDARVTLNLKNQKNE